VGPRPRARSSHFALRIAGTLCICACLATAADEAAGQIDTEQQPNSKQSQISGHVYRSDTGQPISKAQVSLDPQDDKTQETAGGSRIVRTGPDGTFVFSGVPPGSYAINAWRNGFANGRVQWQSNASRHSLTTGQNLDNMILRLVPAGVITGRVFDEDQEPVAGVVVYILTIDFAPGGRRRIYATSSTTTDDQGNYRAAALLPGSYVRTGGFIQRPRQQMPLKQGPAVGLQYRDTYYPGTAVLDEAVAIDVKPGEETPNIRISVVTERTYTVTGAVVGIASDPTLKPSEIHVEKRERAQQMWESEERHSVQTAHTLSPRYLRAITRSLPWKSRPSRTMNTLKRSMQALRRCKSWTRTSGPIFGSVALAKYTARSGVKRTQGDSHPLGSKSL
jgi:protocatechuate 3,4-dioxygenase beta subunit